MEVRERDEFDDDILTIVKARDTAEKLNLNPIPELHYD